MDHQGQAERADRVNLRRIAVEPKNLPEALREATEHLSLQGATALLSTPERFIVGIILSDGTPVDSSGAHVACEPVFEARVFCESSELRWLKTPEGGRAAIVTEGMLTNVPGWRELDTLTAEPVDQVYVLWGQGTGPLRDLPAGWSRLGAARIGALDVPISGVAKGGHAALHAREYLVEREHGNVVVADERLLRLRWTTGAR